MKLNFYKKMSFIIFVGAILRVIAIYLFGDEEVANEWGIILTNLEENNILSVRSVDGVPVPNIFMPPLYPLILFLIKLAFNETHVFLNIVFILQTCISLISIFIVYKILIEIFNQNISIIGSIIYTIFPINIFAVSQISSISLQMFLINLFLYGFIKFFKDPTNMNMILFSLPSSLLILLRGEFLVFVILSLLYLLIKHYCIKKVITSLLLVLILVSPYLYRNYQIFEQVTITKSFGYNLLKGNHPKTLVEGTAMFRTVEKVIPETEKKLDELNKLGPIKTHDLLKDKILLDQAIIFIKEDPTKYIALYFKKFFSFLFFDINSSYPNYYSIFHLLPKILISLTTIGGIFTTASLSKSIKNYFSLFYLANIGLFSIFFILPRYSLSLLTIQIILSLYFVEKINKRFNFLR
tara:strand:+ start:692 stop:1918 length:1227 start_codon:yes stop_codon:yes gene_type:complete